MPGGSMKGSASQTSVTEAELEDLRQKFHLLEGDRKAYYEMSMHTMKSNKVLIQQLREENKELRRGLAAIQRETRSASRQGMTTDQKEMTELSRQVTRLRRQHDKLCSRVETQAQNLSELRDKSAELEVESAKPLAEDSPTTRRIRVLENRLDKAMIKYNEAQSIKKTYEQIVKRLREERVGFDNQLAALERTLAAKEHDYQELLLLSADAQHARDVSQQELERVRNTYQAAKRARERDLRERQEHMQIRIDITDRMEEREKIRDELVNQASEELVTSKEQMLKKGAALNSIAQGEIIREKQRHNEQIGVFEDAFEKIKEATGVADINEVIHKIVNQEDTQNNLMQLSKENDATREQLRQQMEDLQNKVNELKYSGTGVTQKRKLVDDHENNLSAASSDLERSKLKAERLSTVLINVKAGIQHIAERLEPHRDSQEQGFLITDDTVVEVLYQCDSILGSLLSEIRTKRSDPGSTAAPLFSNTEVLDEMHLAVTDAQIQSTRKFNQRVKLPTGDADLDTIAEEDLDDVGAKEMDDDELTRDKIKKASTQFAQQHDKTARKKSKAASGKKRRRTKRR